MTNPWFEFQQYVKQVIAPELHRLHAPIDEWLARIPMTAARYLTLGFFVVAGIWVLCLPRTFVYLGAPDQARWRDLRVWAIAVLIPYILVYWWLG